MPLDVHGLDQDKLAVLATEGGIAEIEALAAGETPPDEVKAPEGTPAETPAAEPETPASETKTAPDEADHAKGVSTKDGKGVIPYAVLKGTRERASALQSENETLRKQVEDLTQRATQADTPATEKGAMNDMDAKIEAMRAKAEALKTDFPELAETLIANAELLAENRRELLALRGSVQADRDQSAAREQRTIDEQIQDAIDANQTLSAWQVANGTEWQAAVSADVMLRQQPDWAEKTFVERFDKVVELVKVLNPAAKTVEVPPSPPEPTTPATPVATKARAPVNSLSDIPGGVAPAASMTEQMADLSPVALERKFGAMTPDQIQDYLASLA